MNKSLKKFLSERGVKISVLAKRIGVSYKTFYNKLSGNSEFTQTEIRELSDFLGLKLEQIETLFLESDLTNDN